jgi:hypothetical protein
MAKKTVLIGSKLPNGLILNHPHDLNVKVTLRGLNDAAKGTNGQPIQIPYITTEVDAEFWAAWKLSHNHKDKPFKPLASGAIFEAGSTADDAKATYREREKEKTGFEPADPKAFGVKTDNGKD